MDPPSGQDRPPPWDTTDWVLATAACAASAMAVVGAAFLVFGPERRHSLPADSQQSLSPENRSSSGKPLLEATSGAGAAGKRVEDPSELKKRKRAAAVPAKPTAADLFDATEALASKASLPAEKWRAAAVIATLASHGEPVPLLVGSLHTRMMECWQAAALCWLPSTHCSSQLHFASTLAGRSKPMLFEG